MTSFFGHGSRSTGSIAGVQDDDAIERSASNSLAKQCTISEGGSGTAPAASTKPLAGSTTSMASWEDGVPQSWMPGDGCCYKLRIGPNYRRYGKKLPSAGQLYDLIAIDHVKNTAPCDFPVTHYAKYVRLPPASSDSAVLACVNPVVW